MTFAQAILALVLLATLLQLASIAIALLRAVRLTPDRPRERPPITILRPACGIENHIEATLASAYRIDYPDFEIVFCVASAADPIVPVIERLMAAHPDIPSRLLTGDDRISINPKLNNLVKGWKAAAHDWIVMADSNVLMPPDYLDRLVARWTPGTGLVCSPPVGSAPEGMAADLECAFLNSYQARWQFVADGLGMGFAQGKTMLWRRADLDRAGGIAALATQSAEDAAATKLVRAAGLKVRLVDRAFPQPLGTRSFGEVWHRQIRWARLRRDTFKLWFLPELLAGGFFPLTAAIGLAATGELPLPGLAALFAAWYGGEILLAAFLRWPLGLRAPLVYLFRDLLLPVLWLAAWGGSTFVWRGNAMDLRPEDARLRGAARASRPERIRAFKRRPRGETLTPTASRSRWLSGRKTS